MYTISLVSWSRNWAKHGHTIGSLYHHTSRFLYVGHYTQSALSVTVCPACILSTPSLLYVQLACRVYPLTLSLLYGLLVFYKLPHYHMSCLQGKTHSTLLLLYVQLVGYTLSTLLLLYVQLVGYTLSHFHYSMVCLYFISSLITICPACRVKPT